MGIKLLNLPLDGPFVNGCTGERRPTVSLRGRHQVRQEIAAW